MDKQTKETAQREYKKISACTCTIKAYQQNQVSLVTLLRLRSY